MQLGIGQRFLQQLREQRLRFAVKTQCAVAQIPCGGTLLRFKGRAFAQRSFQRNIEVAPGEYLTDGARGNLLGDIPISRFSAKARLLRQTMEIKSATRRRRLLEIKR